MNQVTSVYRSRVSESEISRLSAEIGTLIGFLRERRIPSRDKLEEKLAILSKSEIELKARLANY